MDGAEKQARVWLGRCRSEPSPGATRGCVSAGSREPRRAHSVTAAADFSLGRV